ncbi:hypothetical protein DW721_13080 [Clostridium sp. AM27-31LB]|nr:hypothetical protein DWZ63_09450 [Clostridium sp. AF34-13]RHT90522.1 hypothetical protein DW721_13080 [Clostridium sp. AM27-31LB]
MLFMFSNLFVFFFSFMFSLSLIFSLSSFSFPVIFFSAIEFLLELILKLLFLLSINIQFVSKLFKLLNHISSFQQIS